MTNANAFRLEIQQSRDFLKWLTGENCELICEPDAPGHVTRDGGHPEAVFQDTNKNTYAIEVKRLLPPKIRSLEYFVQNHVAKPVEGLLPGTFILYIDITQLVNGQLDKQLASAIVEDIKAVVQSQTLEDSKDIHGFIIAKVSDQGSQIYPYILGNELPHDLSDGSTEASELRELFERQVKQTDQKFKDYQSNRIFLMDIGQSGLIFDFHAQVFKDSKGILLKWAELFCTQTINLDFLFIEPGVRVWLPPNDQGQTQQIYAGTRWVDMSRGFYPLLWRRPSKNRIGRLAL